MRFVGRFALPLLSVLAAPFLFSGPIYNFGAANATFSDKPVTLGFVFTPNTTFSVTALGWFDGSGAGFQTEHTVAVFDAGGNVLSATTLAIGTANPLSGSFRYQAITPITLDAGAQYTLAGTSGGALDPWTVNDFVSGFAVNPEFTVGHDAARFFYGPNLVDPDAHFADYLVYAGPNLDGSAVPEPAGAWLFALGLGALVVTSSLTRLRKRRNAVRPLTLAPLL